MSMKSSSSSQCAVINAWKRLKPDLEDEFNHPRHQILSYFEAESHSKRQGSGRGRGRGRCSRSGGGVHPIGITGDSRTELIALSKLALYQYNAANTLKNQEEGEEECFVFHDLVAATRAICSGCVFYITFHAKPKAKGDADAITTTFLAKVWKRVGKGNPPLVRSCFLKPECGEQQLV